MLDIIEEEGLQENARIVGAKLHSELSALVESFPVCASHCSTTATLGHRSCLTRTGHALRSHILLS